MTICLISKVKDFFGVWEVSILIDGKEYTYPISSEFALKKFEVLLKKRRYGKALNILKQFKIESFNSFERRGT